MTWTAQALHVTRKDVRYTRWALVVYSIFVVVALAHALMLPYPGKVFPASTGPLSVTMFVLVLLGVVLAATAVQTDSPIQSNAFWASRPFDPTAMLGAKLLYCAVVLVGVPLVAQLLGMMQYSVAPAAIVAGLLKSAVAYGLILLCAVVIASLTIDLRGFIVGALILVLAILLLVVAFSDHLPSMFQHPSKTLWFIVAAGTAIALLVVLYRRRGLGRMAWIGAAFVVGAAFVAFDAIDRPPSTNVRPALRTATVSIDSVGSGSKGILATSGLNGTRLQVRLSLDNVPANARLGIQVDSMLLRLRDGTAFRGGMLGNRILNADAEGALPPGIRQFGASSGPITMTLSSLFPVDSSKATAIGMSNLDVWAHVDVAEAVPLASTRIGQPLTASARGTRLHISDDFAEGENSIHVVAATLVSGRLLDPRNLGMAVINEKTREGVVVSGNYFTSNDWLILPGAPIITSTIQLNAATPAVAEPAILRSVPGIGPVSEQLGRRRNDKFPDIGWYRDAKLIVVQWEPRGSYPVRVSKTLNE